MVWAVCPDCKSNRITTEMWGKGLFAAAKTRDQAGFICMSCGHHWNPKG